MAYPDSETSLNLETLGPRLSEQLRRVQPSSANRSCEGFSMLVGRERSRFGPRLSYGRHRGPSRADSRRAAVAIVIYPSRISGELCVTLTRRPSDLTHHGGQVCLPGGRIEHGETSAEAALREYHEELGVQVQVVDELGRLRPIYVFASDNLVDTIVFWAETPPHGWKPDPVEVDEVIELPLQVLLDLAGGGGDRCEIVTRKKSRGGKVAENDGVFQFEFAYQAFRFRACDDRQCEVWGATAMLLDEFAAVIARAMVGRP